MAPGALSDIRRSRISHFVNPFRIQMTTRGHGARNHQEGAGSFGVVRQTLLDFLSTIDMPFDCPRYFHYTNSLFIDLIRLAGKIRRTVTSVERPAVWMSKNPLWEEMAAMFCLPVKPDFNAPGVLIVGHPQDRFRVFQGEERKILCGGLYRIEVSYQQDRNYWPDLARAAYLSREWKACCERTAAWIGADPSDWAASLSEVPRKHWVAVEHWQDGEWCACSSATRYSTIDESIQAARSQLFRGGMELGLSKTSIAMMWEDISRHKLRISTS